MSRKFHIDLIRTLPRLTTRSVWGDCRQGQVTTANSHHYITLQTTLTTYIWMMDRREHPSPHTSHTIQQIYIFLSVSIMASKQSLYSSYLQLSSHRISSVSYTHLTLPTTPYV